MIGKTISHYQFLEKLGEGGMGEVYLAQDTELDRKVALKFLPPHYSDDPDIKARFKHEAKAAAALNHPNIVTIYEVGEHDSKMFMVMEYTEGESLSQLLAGEELSIKKAIDLASQVCAGLREAHQAGIVHRDIKPANILIDTKGRVRVADFGLAKTEEGSRLTKEASTLGTVEYMSPEQARGEDVDPRSDIFSFGVVLYEMIAGQRPFQGDYHAAVSYSIVHEEPEPLARYKTGVSEGLQRIVDKALDKNPGTRYQHIDDLLADLKALHTKQPSRVAKSQSAEQGLKAASPKWTLLIGGIGVLAVLAIVTVINFKPSTSDLADKKSIAVLPFENLSGRQEEEYFSDGMTEEVLSQIAKIADLKVISMLATRHYKNTEKSPQEIGVELNVANLLTGRVQRAGHELRVGCELVDASTGTQLWATSYRRKMENIFDIQSEVAQQIAQTLKGELSGEEITEMTQRLSTNLDAYDYYLRGNDYRAGGNKEQDIEMAIQMYEKAVELDSTFSVAYAAVARARLRLHWWFGQEEQVAKAKATLDMAQALAPDAPETHIALGYYFYWGFRDYDKALEHLMIAQRRRPNDAESVLAIGGIQRRQGRWQEALASMEKAIELNPRDYLAIIALSATYLWMRQYSQAERYLDRAISVAPDDPFAYGLKVDFYRDGYGDTQKARQLVEEAVGRFGPQEFRHELWLLNMYDRNYEQALKTEVFGSDTLGYYLCKSRAYYFMKQTKPTQVYADSARLFLQLLLARLSRQPLAERDRRRPSLHGMLGECYALLGSKKAAIRECMKAAELRPISGDAFYGPRHVIDLAKIYTLVGEYDAAIDQLAYLLAIPSMMTVHRLRLDPTWDPLREHPRFKELLAEYSGNQK